MVCVLCVVCGEWCVVCGVCCVVSCGVLCVCACVRWHFRDPTVRKKKKVPRNDKPKNAVIILSLLFCRGGKHPTVPWVLSPNCVVCVDLFTSAHHKPQYIIVFTQYSTVQYSMM